MELKDLAETRVGMAKVATRRIIISFFILCPFAQWLFPRWLSDCANRNEKSTVRGQIFVDLRANSTAIC